MTAASRRPAVAKKRKVSVSDDPSERPPKKKSPLFNQPQNYYAPPKIASMTKDELSEWRKEQRRKRNRESAAASRNKTRAKIEELEGEVSKWKHMYHEMETKMRCMERHIQFLTKYNRDGGQPRTISAPGLQPLPTPTAVVSNPNSPPRSPSPPSTSPPAVVPCAVTSFLAPPPAYSSHVAASHVATQNFPPLFCEPQDFPQVESQIDPISDAPHDESRKHLNLIPRQAVKITGATNEESVERVGQWQSSGLTVCGPEMNRKEEGEAEGIACGGSPDVAQAKAVSSVEVDARKQAQAVNPFPATNEDAGLDGFLLPDPNNEDVDLLDLLVDTLDGDFDPNILI